MPARTSRASSRCWTAPHSAVLERPRASEIGPFHPVVVRGRPPRAIPQRVTRAGYPNMIGTTHGAHRNHHQDPHSGRRSARAADVRRQRPVPPSPGKQGRHRQIVAMARRKEGGKLLVKALGPCRPTCRSSKPGSRLPSWPPSGEASIARPTFEAASARWPDGANGGFPPYDQLPRPMRERPPDRVRAGCARPDEREAVRPQIWVVRTAHAGTYIFGFVRTTMQADSWPTCSSSH
jgi:hypothetical protein